MVETHLNLLLLLRVRPGVTVVRPGRGPALVVAALFTAVLATVVWQNASSRPTPRLTGDVLQPISGGAGYDERVARFTTSERPTLLIGQCVGSGTVKFFVGLQGAGGQPRQPLLTVPCRNKQVTRSASVGVRRVLGPYVVRVDAPASARWTVSAQST